MATVEGTAITLMDSVDAAEKATATMETVGLMATEMSISRTATVLTPGMRASMTHQTRAWSASTAFTTSGISIFADSAHWYVARAAAVRSLVRESELNVGHLAVRGEGDPGIFLREDVVNRYEQK